MSSWLAADRFSPFLLALAVVVLIAGVGLGLFLVLAPGLLGAGVSISCGELSGQALVDCEVGSERARNDLRTVGIGMAAGGALLFGAFVTGATYLQNREGQITERHSRAMQLLADDKASVRIGGIYALERIAQDSQRDHWPVMQTLTRFARLRSLESGRSSGADSTKNLELEAVGQVIGRRKWRGGESLRLEMSGIDFRQADLEGAHFEKADLLEAKLGEALLTKAHLKGAVLLSASLVGAWLPLADLEEANLGAADLSGANLSGANLRKTHLIETRMVGVSASRSQLTEAGLIDADLSKANLTRANLDRAVLTGARLAGTWLWEASLREADLTGAHLEGANFRDAQLEGANLEGVTYDENTNWPEGFEPPS